jgi:hypothetical protein
MLLKIALSSAIALLVGACVVSPVPEGYTGPVAHITDTMTPRNAMSTDFFTLTKINGFNIVDSISATDGSNRTPGALKTPVIIARDVPTNEGSFTIVGHTHYVAPVLALTNTVYDVGGEIKFAPLANHSYVVKGVLGDNYSAVWIEDAKTGEVAGHKIEIKGSAALSTAGKLDLK